MNTRMQFIREDHRHHVETMRTIYRRYGCGAILQKAFTLQHLILSTPSKSQ